MEKFGVVVGKFYPLHRGHVDLIQRASSKVEKLIVVVSHHDERDNKLYIDSKLKKVLTAKDKLKIVQKTFQNQNEVILPILVDETNCPTYPDGWKEWAELVKTEIMSNRKVPSDFNWSETLFFTSEIRDIKGYETHFKPKEIVEFDPFRTSTNISATQIRENPYGSNWNYLPRAAREQLAVTIAIVGGESSGKTFLTDKLGNYFATTTVWENGRTYCDRELGGDESALQYEDYENISNGHALDLLFAKRNANRFIISDTDFVTTQVFCKTYEKREHPSVQAKIDEIKFDLTILLDNSTRWVDDGMRMIGGEKEREEFQNLLKETYDKNGIEYVEIKAKSYDDRYEISKALINYFMEHRTNTKELQEFVDKLEGEIK